MKTSDSHPSNIASERPQVGSHEEPRSRIDSTLRAAARVDSRAPATKIRRLIADQQYFGVDALAFHAACERMLARMATQGSHQARIDIRSLGDDFRLDATAGWRLLRALLAGGLLQPDGTGRYRPTALFHEYARACVVAPLSRARARTLIDRAHELAVRINAIFVRNPYVIQTVAVSGSYMSRRDPLKELSLWLVLRQRPQAKGRRSSASMSHDEGLRQIGTAMKALSSFVVVRVAADKRDVHRPFAVVFEASDDMVEASALSWERLREWSHSIRHRFVLR